ncbi:hypothetical protein [Comamonas aquatica]|uniref:hypothetical protein n=1 Tax=Comamonas aquatica TaxID=225991 RepID=UPI001EF38D30|nr:hypothetical protein [Comamonas aquatica]
MEMLKKYFQSTHPCAQPAECMRLWISKKDSPGGLKNLSTFWRTKLSTVCVQMDAACDGAGVQAHHAAWMESTLQRVHLLCCKNYFLTVRLVVVVCNFVYLFSKTPTNIADALGCLCIFLF